MLGANAALLISENCDTLASMLKRNGYTTAAVGKWHVGLGGPGDLAAKFSSAPEGLEPGPNQRGFDFSYILTASLDMGLYVYLKNLQPVNGTDDLPAPPFSQWKRVPRSGGGYPAPTGYDANYITPGFDPYYDAHPDVTPRFNHVVPHLTDEAAGWIDRQASAGHPLFLYFAIPAPHTPWVPDVSTNGLSDEQLYMAYVHEVDAEVGRIVDTLRKNGLWENTLLVFSSDNGPELRRFDKARAGYSPSGIYRGMKSELYDGGYVSPDSNPEGTPYQLFNLKQDPSETNNLYYSAPERVQEMKNLLLSITGANDWADTTPKSGGLQKMGFEDTDTDHDGVVTREEFIARQKIINPAVAESTVMNWFNKKDLNHDGELTKAEFLSDQRVH